MVFQSYALFPHLSTEENIVFGLKVRRMPEEERRKRLAKVAEVVGLADLLDRKPQQLSGGQRQRVALARAIIAENDICLMDEPLSNLDAQLRHGMRVEIRELQQRLGMTVVYVTHDQVEAMSMADRVVLIREGRIEQEGSPEELYARPATLFAARFIGTPGMNLLNLADGPGGAVVRGSQDTLFPGRGEGLTLGVRPEHVWLANAGGVGGTVTSSEYHGADTILTVRVGDETLFMRAPGQLAQAAGHAGAARLEAGVAAPVRFGRAARGCRRSASRAALPRRPIDVSQAPAEGGFIRCKRESPSFTRQGERQHAVDTGNRHGSAHGLRPGGVGRHRNHLLLPDRGRRPAHQGDRRLRGGFREAEPRRQGEAHLRRQLRRRAHQGARRRSRPASPRRSRCSSRSTSTSCSSRT